MDDVGGTIKNAILRKVKSGQIVVHTPKDFSAMKFEPFIITVYLPKSDETFEPESMHQAPPSPKHIQSTNLFDRSMTEEVAVHNFSRRP